MISFNMSGLKAARAQLVQLERRRALELTQKLTLDLGRRLIEGSPVDTGAFRGAWAIDVPSKPGEPGRVSNPTEYGPALARGHSGQAPQGWIEDAVAAVARFGGRP